MMVQKPAYMTKILSATCALAFLFFSINSAHADYGIYFSKSMPLFATGTPGRYSSDRFLVPQSPKDSWFALGTGELIIYLAESFEFEGDPYPFNYVRTTIASISIMSETGDGVAGFTLSEIEESTENKPFDRVKRAYYWNGLVFDARTLSKGGYFHFDLDVINNVYVHNLATDKAVALDTKFVSASFSFDSLLWYNSPVPEPQSWAMMIGGFALAGGALRRRRYNLKVSLA